MNIPKVDKTSLSKENDVTSVSHGESINLRLHVGDGLGVGLQPGNVDLNVEVTNAERVVRRSLAHFNPWHLLANNGILGHDREVGTSDDIPISGGGDEDVTAGGDLLHGGDLVTGHGSLQGVDGIDLSNDNTSAVGLQRLSALYFKISQKSLHGC